jgi:hypothetical protein
MKTYITLLNFYGDGKSESWRLPNIPNKGDLIVINSTKAIVTFNEYRFSEDGQICNVFIHTTEIPQQSNQH